MDMFIDKLAQRQTAHEIIKANAEAETRELNKLKNQVAGYNECLVKLQRLIDEGFVKIADIRTDKEEMTRIVEESLRRSQIHQQDTEGLKQVQEQLDGMSGMLHEIIRADNEQYSGNMTFQEQILQVDTILRELLGEMANALQEQLGSMNKSVQEKLGGMVRAMQEQLERMGDIIQLQMKGMDKSMQEQVSGMGIAMQEQLGSVGRMVEEQCGNIGRSMQEELESMGGIVQNRLNVLDQSMQEQFADMSKTMQEQIADMSKSMQGSIKESITEQMDLFAADLNEKITGLGEKTDGEATEQFSESVHKECVKVYRNVQAVMVEESGKQNESLDEAKAGITSMKKKLGVVMGISVVAMVCSLANIAFQILNGLNIIP